MLDESPSIAGGVLVTGTIGQADAWYLPAVDVVCQLGWHPPQLGLLV